VCSPTWRALRLPRKGREPIRRTFSVAALAANSDTIPRRGIAPGVSSPSFRDSATFQASVLLWKWEGRVGALILLLSRASDAIVGARLFSCPTISDDGTSLLFNSDGIRVLPKDRWTAKSVLLWRKQRRNPTREAFAPYRTQTRLPCSLSELRLARGTFIIAHGRNVLIH